ncbi:MAG: PD40 domain-containing protein [Verrucomicrobia bacterium]|nr:PD40 domain-containing protein [Verrucomicrobiota bacterium]
MTALQVLALGVAGGWGAGPVFAQLTNEPARPITGPRMPALSPDGKRLAFVYRGDLWLVGSAGGRARPLTHHVEMDAYPVFSPDGKWIAFASKRNGGWDIYAIPAEGGSARQLTWHGGTETPQGWSPDGRRLLFSGRRDTPDFAVYALDVATLRSDVLCEDYAPLSSPHYAPDGRRLVYARYGFPSSRPRYRGSAAAQLWLLDLETRVRRPLTTNGAQHLWPRFLPDGKRVVAVTTGEPTPATGGLSNAIPRIRDNPRRTPNLWVFDLNGNAKPLTRFTGNSVRCPTVAWKSGDIAFEYDTGLWFMRRGRQKPVRLAIHAGADEKQRTAVAETLRREVTEAEPSPDGKHYAFGLRGEIWTVLIQKPKGVAARNADLARRLTDYAGDDSDFSWSPDGKKLYFTSDREFNTRLYELDVATLETRCLWNRNENLTGPRVSPDGKQMGFWVAGPEGGLHVMDLAGGGLRQIARVPGPQWHGLGGGSFAWSPDMQWIAFTRRSASRAWNLWVVPARGGEAVNVTRLYAHHSQPAWSPDGKYLYFQSNRDGDGLYVLPLTPEPVRTIDADWRYEKPSRPPKTVIDFKNITARIRKLGTQSPEADLTVTPQGLIVFLSQGDVWSVSYDGKETRRLTTGGGKVALRVGADGKHAYFMQNGELFTMGMDSKSVTKVTFVAERRRDPAAEHAAAFTQLWNAYHRGFYDPHFHGRDWTALRERYRPMLDGVELGDEFASALNLMVGELDASHGEVTASAGPAAEVTPHLGFTFDYSHEGPGLRVRGVPEGTPASYPRTAIRPGEYVLAINGQEVVLDETLYRLINGKQNREFEFLVSTNPCRAGARTVKYKVLTPDEWKQLAYRNRVDRDRRRVEARSGGRIGYLHLATMEAGQHAQFEREAYEYIADKQALIIDVRFNTGGNIADTLIDWLERKAHGYLRPRDSDLEPAPHQAWEKPMVVLINEHTYSNSEIFAYAMRARRLAQLVGMPTPGYVIWTSPLALVNGTKARLPQTGYYRLDGTPIENSGEVPDALVPLSPDDWLAQRDPQLDRAIELLTPPPPLPEPPAPSTSPQHAASPPP